MIAYIKLSLVQKRYALALLKWMVLLEFTMGLDIHHCLDLKKIMPFTIELNILLVKNIFIRIKSVKIDPGDFNYILL